VARDNWRKWTGSEVCPFCSSDKVAYTLGRNEFMLVVYPMLPSRAQFKHLIQTLSNLCVTSGFRRNVDDICALLGFYAVCSGNSVPKFRDNLSAPSSRVKNSLTLEDATDIWFRNVGRE
jgi:hypothetical protein